MKEITTKLIPGKGTKIDVEMVLGPNRVMVVSVEEARLLARALRDVTAPDMVQGFIADYLGKQRERLKSVFDAVCDPKDWKAPIKAYVRDFKRADVAEAIAFFTATEAAFEDAGNGWLKVTAPGYRLGPAGDH